MSTAVTSTQTATILPKPVAMLKKMDEKPRLQRTSSIDAIKRINTYICSPQSYILPAILTTWLKSSQNGLHSSTEKTIIMFRSIIFGSFLAKYLLRGVKSGSHGGQLTKIDIQRALLEGLLAANQIFLKSLKSKFMISVIFQLTVIYLTVEVGMCVLFLAQSVVPVGLSFLMLCLASIVILGHNINRFHYGTGHFKRKIQ